MDFFPSRIGQTFLTRTNDENLHGIKQVPYKNEQQESQFY